MMTSMEIHQLNVHRCRRCSTLVILSSEDALTRKLASSKIHSIQGGRLALDRFRADWPASRLSRILVLSKEEPSRPESEGIVAASAGRVSRSATSIVGQRG